MMEGRRTSETGPRVVISYTTGNDVEDLRPAIASLLRALLDSSFSNPMNAFGARGKTIVIKPNMVRHTNPRGSLDAVVTSPRVCEVLIQLAAEAVGETGRVVVADSPQNDCEFDVLLDASGWREMLEQVRNSCACPVDLLDMRPESVVMRDGVIVSRKQMRGDPHGEELIDLSHNSAFGNSGLDPSRLRGSDYDPAVTRSSHVDGRHTYSVCRSFLAADLLIVVPKVKTHKKVGLSLAMKNLVGLVGEKNRLPHHTAGFPGSGGDEYPRPNLWPRVRQWSIERSRPLLASGKWTPVFRGLRRMESALLPEIVERSGNWWGNDTAWRMVVDLVSILSKKRNNAQLPTLFLYDGLVAGEGLGPLAPDALPLGLLAASLDPVAGDWAVARELGVDPLRFPLLREAKARAIWSQEQWDEPELIRLSSPKPTRPLILHPGWLDAPVPQ
jgi:uncharacterized protein (DUF362 family)